MEVTPAEPLGKPGIFSRMQTFRNLTQAFEIPITPELVDNHHFWYLTSREYAVQRFRIPEEMGLADGRSDQQANIRKLAIKNAVDHAATIVELQKKAATDSLTGAPNREAIDNFLLHLMQHRRKETIDVVAMVDIDHFKTVNDTYGHGVGDVALQELVRLINENIRGVDLFGRYGGEEFTLVLPEVDADMKIDENGHQRILERIDALRVKISQELTQRVKEKSLSLNSKVAQMSPLTASFGVIVIDKKIGVPNKTELERKVYNTADALLYEAKNRGRNLVVSAAGPFRK